MRSIIRGTAVLTACLIAAWSASAQEQARPAGTCAPDDFASLIDDTGAYLRDISASTQPELRRRFDLLARLKGWQAAETEERGYELIHDERMADYDARARKLLIDLDTLGAVTEAEADCARLERLEAVTRELKKVTEAKARHLTARLDAALAAARPSPEAGETPASASRAEPRIETAPSAAAPPAEPPPDKQALVTPDAWSTENRPAAAPAPAPSAGWEASTTATPAPSQTPSQPFAEALPTPMPVPADQTFSATEIRQAGRGLFGSISASLASVIRYAFDTYGEPNGYILGTEGGGALLAGLSYGSGRLTTKMGPPVDVYWQGPSVGYDLGLTGSRVMFLVYNLESPDDIFRRFGGLGGSAYVVGGVGITYHMRGSIVLAPIRTGLGLRIGASIGYLKFTPERSLNPF